MGTADAAIALEKLPGLIRPPKLLGIERRISLSSTPRTKQIGAGLLRPLVVILYVDAVGHERRHPSGLADRGLQQAQVLGGLLEVSPDVGPLLRGLHGRPTP